MCFLRKNLVVYFAAITLLIMLSCAFTADRRLRFRKYSWIDIGRSARSQNKMIFVLVTGKYCPTSKKMNRVVSEPKVCEFYNNNFVSTTFDAQNPTQYYRASNWGVSSIPALVFLTKNREVVYISQGYQDANGMISEAKTALEMNNPAKAKQKSNGAE